MIDPIPEAELRELGLGDLLRRVPRGDVADLVADHARELRLVRHVGHQAAGHVDVPAGERERVHRRVVDDVELPGQRGPLGLRGHLLADLRDVALHVRVGDEGVGLLDLGGGLLPELDLLLLRDERDLPVPRDRVADTAGRHDHEHDGENSTTRHTRCSSLSGDPGLRNARRGAKDRRCPVLSARQSGARLRPAGEALDRPPVERVAEGLVGEVEVQGGHRDLSIPVDRVAVAARGCPGARSPSRRSSSTSARGGRRSRPRRTP